jgi:hypothetical protein
MVGFIVKHFSANGLIEQTVIPWGGTIDYCTFGLCSLILPGFSATENFEACGVKYRRKSCPVRVLVHFGCTRSHFSFCSGGTGFMVFHGLDAMEVETRIATKKSLRDGFQ